MIQRIAILWMLPFILMGCGKPRTQPMTPPSAGSGSGLSNDEWQKMKEFRDTVGGVNLRFKPLDSAISVSVEHWRIPTYGSEGGEPTLGQVDFEGNLPAGYRDGDWVTLRSETVDYGAEVACEQADCRRATVRVHKNSGEKQGQVEASVRRTEFANHARTEAYSRDRTVRAQLLEALQRDAAMVSFSVSEIRGTPKRLFEIEIAFSNRNWSPSEPGYFWAKKAFIRGKVQQGVPALLTLTTQRQASVPQQETISESPQADVNYDPQANRLDVHFVAPPQGLVSFVAWGR